MHWAGTVGLDTVGRAVDRYFEQTGRDHWSPSSLLNKLGAEAKTFEAYDAENN